MKRVGVAGAFVVIGIFLSAACSTTIEQGAQPTTTLAHKPGDVIKRSQELSVDAGAPGGTIEFGLTPDPSQRGVYSLHVQFFDKNGRQVEVADAVDLTLDSPSGKDVLVSLPHLARGHFQERDMHLIASGIWSAKVEVHLFEAGGENRGTVQTYEFDNLEVHGAA